MTEPVRGRLVPPTRLTLAAAGAIAAILAFTISFLVARYPALPDILPVRFNSRGLANGWQYKNWLRVFLPVLTQSALSTTFGMIALLLLYRPHSPEEHRADDMVAAAAAAEAVVLVALVWVAFQAYAGVALAVMWQRGFGGLGLNYGKVTWIGIGVSALIFIRATREIGRPSPRPFEPSHWRFGRLYQNPRDPALFVPTVDGSHWTLNFGRPFAAALLGAVLAIGIFAPTIILGLLLRG
jgi:uncharacterized membrane protein